MKNPSRLLIFLLIGTFVITGCRKNGVKDDESPLQLNMDEELPGTWKATEMYADLVVTVGNIKADVKITNDIRSGGVSFDRDVYKAQFDIITEMTIDIIVFGNTIHKIVEDSVEIDSRLSYEIVTENEFRFYVNDSTDEPIKLFNNIAFDDITFFPIEKSERDLFLKANVDIMTNFGDDVPELPSGDLPTTGTLYMRLQKVTP
jgi:hypothetical protein